MDKEEEQVGMHICSLVNQLIDDAFIINSHKYSTRQVRLGVSKSQFPSQLPLCSLVC